MAPIMNFTAERFMDVPEDGFDDDDFYSDLACVKQAATLPALLLRRSSSSKSGVKLEQVSTGESHYSAGEKSICKLETDYSPMQGMSEDGSEMQRLQTMDATELPVSSPAFFPAGAIPMIAVQASPLIASPCMVPMVLSPMYLPCPEEPRSRLPSFDLPSPAVESTDPKPARTALRSSAALFVPATARPRVVSWADATEEEEEEETRLVVARTTLVLKNLPAGFSRDQVVELMHSQGFKDSLDFIYVPMNFKTMLHFGYAFANFVSSDAAEMCKELLDGFTAWGVSTDKVCVTEWSESQQGLGTHVERYRNSPVMHASVDDEFKPALYKLGFRVPFPAPTKTVKAPRARKD